MNIKRNIIFALEGRKKNGVAITENVPIRMRVNYSGQRIEFTMPYRIDAAKWDATKQKVKNGCAKTSHKQKGNPKVAFSCGERGWHQRKRLIFFSKDDFSALLECKASLP